MKAPPGAQRLRPGLVEEAEDSPQPAVPGRDGTAGELALESFYPADETTAETLRELAR